MPNPALTHSPERSWTAAASDLVLGSTSDEELCKRLAPLFASLPQDIGICHGRGVPSSLGAHLPRRNDVIVPCFLSAAQHQDTHTATGTATGTAGEANSNRALAEHLFVVEQVHQRIKAWRMLSPGVARESLHQLNHVWWWALGFSNLSLRALRPLPTISGAVRRVTAAVLCRSIPRAGGWGRALRAGIRNRRQDALRLCDARRHGGWDSVRRLSTVGNYIS
jgi:hypothetical protein